MKPTQSEAWSGSMVRARTANLLRLSLLVLLTLGLLPGPICGQGMAASTTLPPQAVGPTVGAHPFLRKWSSQPLEQARTAAQSGDASAQYYLGWAHLCGLGTPPDTAEALRWFQKAAEQGVPEAQVKMGLFYELGIATPQDFTEAIKWYEQAAGKGYAGAQVRLGMICGGLANVPRITVNMPGASYSGPAMGSDPPQACQWLSLAAEQGYPPAQVYLSQLLRRGDLTVLRPPNLTNQTRIPSQAFSLPKPDLANPTKWLFVAAGQGDQLAERSLFARQYRVRGQIRYMDIDEKDAAEAKRQADAFLATHPAKDWTHVTEVLFHLNPATPPKGTNSGSARFDHLLNTARNGSVTAQYLMALSFQHDAYSWDPRTDLSRLSPSGTARAPEEQDRTIPARTRLAGQWYAAAAAQGHGPSILNLAFMYAAGRLGDGHRAQAVEWFSRLAQQGQSEAQFQLGRMFQEGKAVTANFAEAVKLYRAAAAKGHPGALQALGLSGASALPEARTASIPSLATNAPPHPTVRTTEKAVRLAIVPADPSFRAATDVLTALLSQQSDLQLLERSEIDRVFQELTLAAASQRDFLKLGQTLGADGLLTLESAKVDQQQRLQLTLAAVGPGVVLASEQYRLPLEDLPGWSALVTKQLQFQFPKLAVSAAHAVPVSILNLRSPLSNPEAVALDRQLTLLLVHRLARERELFVLERRRMDALEREKQFQGKERAAFWNGSYLLDGMVNPEGLTNNAVSVRVRLVPPAGGEGTLVEVSGGRDQLARLVDELTGKILTVLHRQPQVTAWNPLDEAARYFEEAHWGLRWGMIQEAQAAADAGWALGLHTHELAVMRVQSHGRQAQNKRGATTYGDGTVTFEFAPDPATVPPAIRALELFLEHSHSLPPSNPPDAAWHMLGVEQLARTTTLMEHFFHTPKVRQNLEAPLAELRARARETAELLRRIPATQARTESLLVKQGAFWQDEPEAAIRLYRELAESGVGRRVAGDDWSPPRLISWTGVSRRHEARLWSSFLESLSRSTNAAARLEGVLWGAASADNDYELEERLEKLFATIWENRQRILSSEINPSYWRAVEGFLRARALTPAKAPNATPVIERLRREVVPEFIARMASARAGFDKHREDANRLELVDVLRKALRGEAQVNTSAYWQKFSKLEFTVQEARELLAMWDPAHNDLFPGGALKAKLKAKLPPQEVDAKRLALVDALRRDLRDETAIQPFEFTRKYQHAERDDLDIKPDEAKELLPLVQAYRRRFGHSVYIVTRLEGMLRQALPATPATAPAVALGPPIMAPPVPRATASVLPTPLSVAAEVLNVTRFCPSPLKPTPQRPINDQCIMAARFRQDRLWLVIDYDENAARGARAWRRVVCAVEMGTWATQIIDVPYHAPESIWVSGFSWSHASAQRLELHGDYLLMQTDQGVQKHELRQGEWRVPATKLPEQTRFFSLGERLYATTEDTILEFDPKTDAIQVLASCRQRPVRTTLDGLERFNFPTVFPDAQGRPCVLLADKVHTYDSGRKDWKEIANFPGGTLWQPTVQPNGRLLWRSPNSFHQPATSVGFLAERPPPNQERAGEASALVREINVREALLALRDKAPDLFPAGSVNPASMLPFESGAPLGYGWTAAMDDRDLWVLVDTLRADWRADTKRFELQPGGRGHLLLLCHPQCDNRPVAIPLLLTIPPGAFAGKALNKATPGRRDAFDLVPVPGGFLIVWPPMGGAWFLPREALQPALDTHARTAHMQPTNRLHELRKRQQFWLQILDRNRDGVIAPDEEKAAPANGVYQSEQAELRQLLKQSEAQPQAPTPRQSSVP